MTDGRDNDGGDGVIDRLRAEPHRIHRLLDLTASNCCLRSVAEGFLDDLVEAPLDVSWDSWLTRAEVRRLRPLVSRLRWSRLLGKLAVAVE